MRLQNLKIGDKIDHYCSGIIVEGTIKKKGIDFVETEHNPVTWGQQTFTRTTIQKSTGLQYETSQTTPSAWFKNQKLKA